MLSVVIPALNEEAAIEETVVTIRDTLEAAQIKHEIIVVSDGSTDATASLARDSGAEVLEHPAPGGYGKSLKDGIARAKYDLIAITDADGTYPNDRLVELFELVVASGYDMAIGARTGPHYRGTFLKMPARKIFLWLSEYATGRQIDDINSGLRVFKKEIALRYQHTISNGFSFTTTITLAAMLNGYFVKYIPIDYFKRKGSSHVRYWRDTLRALQIIVENVLFYNPLKLYLLLVNTLVFVALVTGAVSFFLSRFRQAQLLCTFLAALSFVGAFVVAAIGLLAALNRAISKEGE